MFRDFPGLLRDFLSLSGCRLAQGLRFGCRLGDYPLQLVGSDCFGLQKARQFIALPFQPSRTVHCPPPELDGTAKKRTQCVQAGPNLVKGCDV